LARATHQETPQHTIFFQSSVTFSLRPQNIPPHNAI